MMPLAKRLFAIFLVALLPTFCCGQAELAQSSNDPPTPQAVPSARPDKASFATVDLIALDTAGKPVTDLKPEELRLFEDKIEQKIKAVSPSANEPLMIGLFFDVSGSRRADRYVDDETRLSSELVHSVWHQGDTAFLLGFGPRAIVVTQPTQKPEEIDQGLKQIPGGYWGSTALYDALCLVSPTKLAEIPGRKIYVVFSDFEDNSSRNTVDHVIEIAHEAHISIFPVILNEGFGGGNSKRAEKRASEQARKFAEETGGEVLIPDSGKQLPMIFQRLSSDIQCAYRLTYFTSELVPQTKREKKRKIQIETTREHTKLIYPKA
jgi:VWFA-related protein